MILVIDNYDSFTYNLVQYIGDIKKDIVTKRNDETSLKNCLLYTSPSPRDVEESRMPSSA